MNQITPTINVSDERLANLLCSALEGGSNYWYRIEAYQQPSAYPDLPFLTMRDRLFEHIDFPMNEGGSITICAPDDPDRKPVVLDKAKLLEGLTVMAMKFPSHFSDFLLESDDADTGDAFLQCCCFGDLIFG